jgi:biopolymer transport protein ExbD
MKLQRSPLDDEDINALVNLTPLLDVLFVILILFIFISPFLEIDHVELVPSEIAKEEKKQLEYMNADSIVISVTKDDQFMLNHQFIKFEDLKTLLPKLKKDLPLAVPRVYPDESAHFRSYQNLKNVLEASGFKEMDIILQSK